MKYILIIIAIALVIWGGYALMNKNTNNLQPTTDNRQLLNLEFLSLVVCCKLSVISTAPDMGLYPLGICNLVSKLLTFAFL